MPKYMHITVTDERASKESQVHLNRSSLPFSPEVEEIEAEIKKDPGNPDLWIKKGIALSKQMLFREAIEAYSTGLTYNPFHALTYRHRGHRLISVYRFHEGALDLELSSRLDPTNWDTWYHLGLAYYLLKDYERAEKAYKRCMEMTDSDDLVVAIVDWYWMTLMRLGKKEEAAELLKLVSEDTDPGENISYKKRVLMYKGIIKPEDLIEFDGAEFPDLELATQGYGLANYYLLMGKNEKANELLEKIIAHDTFWSAFGYLAAVVDYQSK
jgi:tetratricopeptide (TPR) repeat protein